MVGGLARWLRDEEANASERAPVMGADEIFVVSPLSDAPDAAPGRELAHASERQDTSSRAIRCRIMLGLLAPGGAGGHVARRQRRARPWEARPLHAGPHRRKGLQIKSANSSCLAVLDAAVFLAVLLSRSRPPRQADRRRHSRLGGCRVGVTNFGTTASSHSTSLLRSDARGSSAGSPRCLIAVHNAIRRIGELAANLIVQAAQDNLRGGR